MSILHHGQFSSYSPDVNVTLERVERQALFVEYGFNLNRGDVQITLLKVEKSHHLSHKFMENKVNFGKLTP